MLLMYIKYYFVKIKGTAIAGFFASVGLVGSIFDRPYDVVGVQ